MNNEKHATTENINDLYEMLMMVNGLKANVSIHQNILEVIGESLTRDKQEKSHQSAMMVTYEVGRLYSQMNYLLEKANDDNQAIINAINELINISKGGN